MDLELKTFNIRDKQVELFAPKLEQVKERFSKGDSDFPYWSQVWPSAIAMADFIICNPHYVQHKNVLELGAGLGLPSMVAAPHAKNITCSDYLPESINAIRLSAQHNRLQNLTTAILNWHSLPTNLEADILLLSDINYDPDIFSNLQQIIHQFLDKGSCIILTTPQRLVAKSFLTDLLPFVTLQQTIPVIENQKEIIITLMVLEKIK